MKNTLTKEYEELLRASLEARMHSYAPYSHFAVGAALLCEDGTVIKGCNVENASYPVGICAERNAMSHAVFEGRTKFKAIAITGGPAGKAAADFCAPCGMCRQFMREFCGKDFEIVLAKCNEAGEITETRIHTMEEILPDSFGPENLS